VVNVLQAMLMEKAKKQVAIRMRESVYSRLESLAEKENQTITAVINRAIAIYLKNQELNHE
jgi:predicted transcriptional regulator